MGVKGSEMDWTDVEMELSAAGQEDLAMWVHETLKELHAERDALQHLADDRLAQIDADRRQALRWRDALTQALNEGDGVYRP